MTFLLADLEGSVRLWESDRAAMTLVVRRFDSILEAEVTRYHGVRPVEQGEGDSFVVAFGGASDAVSFAVALQRAIADEAWPGDVALCVRMALHTGEAQLRDEGNYVGNAINRAGRLRSLAHGGQILVSPTTFELVADNLPDETALRDLGLQRIRDLGRPLRVYQVMHPDLDEVFPPLRSLDVLTEHLPASLTAFIGRESELRDITHHLSDARLLTLTGAGGCGKTRLAVEVARAIAEQYPDGIRFADLSLVTQADGVPRAVATAFDRSEQPHQDVIATLVEHLRTRRVLLVLDNCEHLLAACADLTRRLLQACPMLTILATSREPLRVDGEVSWRVPSMATPGRGSFDALTTYDAVRLFIERAVQARSNFSVTNENAPAVAAICQQLDGIPLAIELAAARVRVITVDQIAAGLSDRFHLLRGGAHDELPRQQTLAASVEWSHDLLSQPERALLRRTSVFAGGFTLDAAEEVCSDDGIDAYEVLDLLSSVVDKSLVAMEEHGTSARYRLLETIRQFAHQQLDAAGETATTRERHARWFAAFAMQGGSQLTGPDQVAWYGRLEDEHDNLRAALDWAVTAPAPELGMTMVAALTWFWNVHGHWHEAVRWIDKVRAGGVGTDPLFGLVELVGTAMRGMVGDAGDADACVAVAEAAAVRFRATGDHWGLAWSLNMLGKYTSFRDVSRALAYLDEGVEEARAAGDWSVLTDTLMFAAWNDLAVGRTASAVARVEEAQRASTEAGDARGQLVACNPLAAAAIRRSDFSTAAAVLEEAMEAAAAVGDRFSMAVALLVSGDLELSRGQYERARELFHEGVEVGKETGSSFLSAAGSFLAAGMLAAGDPRGALAIDASRSQSGDDIGSWLHFLSPRPALRGEALLALGDLPAARTSIERTLRTATAAGQTFAAAHALLARARVAYTEVNVSLAEADAHVALDFFVGAEAVAATISTLELLAGCAAATESYVEAARLLGATRALRAEYGCVRPVIEHADHARTMEILQSRLDSEVLESALADGAGMSLSAVCAYAARGRGVRKRPSAGWESLTPTELDVVRLVATGATNHEVADRLFISTNTVKTHLAHVFAKVGVATRSELATQATLRGL